jgi:TonB family protein
MAIGSTVLIALIMLAFSFIPFSSRTGRKATPLIALLVIGTIIASLTAIVFWEARTSIMERDRDRDDYLEQNRDHISGPTPPGPPFDDPDTNSNDANVDDQFREVPDTNSKPLPKTISGGVLNGKAISLPKPPYPAAARSVNASGSVSVQVLVNEKGEVVSANAVSGHPLLRPAAVQAARAARFSVTKLSGQPVKVSGVLTYNFSER